MKHSEVIIRPLVTEKSTSMREKFNKYSFVVHKDANKIVIKEAIKKLFNVTPLSVNVVNVMGKKKRQRYNYGFTSSYKKAIVALKKGEKIGIFEGA
jgi:large subunit ribosomal protein L23